MKNIILTFLLFYSCSYINDEVDVRKYPEISVFFENRYFVKSKHFFDKGEVEFYFKTNNPNFLKYSDSIASFNLWSIIYSSSNRRIYIKQIENYPCDNNTDTLIIQSIDTDIVLIWK